MFFCGTKITKDRKYAAEQGIDENVAFEKGLKKSKQPNLSSRAQKFTQKSREENALEATSR
jgi:hypothetical protein